MMEVLARISETQAPLKCFEVFDDGPKSRNDRPRCHSLHDGIA
jgi:hypothetical protein